MPIDTFTASTTEKINSPHIHHKKTYFQTTDFMKVHFKKTKT